MSVIVILPCLLLPGYWAYLLLTTQPVIIFDAIGYDALGRQILGQGFASYFHTLNREPLFPCLIACAMALSKAFGPLYPFFLKGILLLFLALTLAGIYRLTRLLGAGRVAAGIGALYGGLSPAILNSTLWLWSEAAALPWAIWGVIFFIKSWRLAMSGSRGRRAVLYSCVSASLFIVLLLVKAVVSVVAVLYGLPLLAAGIFFIVRRDHARARTFVLSAVIFLGLFIGAVEGYKSVNWVMNGNYALTTRYHWALYGNTVRRLQPLTADRVSQAVLSVPRLGFCEKYYGRECVFWSFQTSDEISEQATAYYGMKKVSAEQQRKILVDSSFKVMAEHPFQQIAMSALEGSKMLFWENRPFFVRYPLWLTRLYNSTTLTYTLCFGWAFFGLLALAFAFTRRHPAYLLTASFVFWFMAVHSIFFIDIRYGLPIAPLFIALVAAMFSGDANKRME